MIFYFTFTLALICLFLVYYFYSGPSKIEREIRKNGGLHNCFYCKKEIHINDHKCKYCEKINYSGIRKNRKSHFFVIMLLVIFGLFRFYDKMVITY